jgi:DNA-binding IscR family transcriptional regulator
MGSEDRRLVVKSRYDFADYRYTLKGKEYKRNQAINMILDVLDVKAMTINELSEMFEINGQPMLNLIKVMRENNLITNTKLRRNGHYLFKSRDDCLLAKVMYPVDKVEQSFTVKSSKKRMVDEGTSKSEMSSKYNISYGNSYYNSVYWGE